VIYLSKCIIEKCKGFHPWGIFQKNYYSCKEENCKLTNITQQSIKTANFETYLNRTGQGNSEVILFLHGSGPGVTSFANWRYALNACSEQQSSRNLAKE
jgi:hypothetical protein